MRRWVNRIREFLQDKELRINYIRAHQGKVGNDLADSNAEAAISLPMPKPVFPHDLWQVSYEGELVDSPHKVWAKVQVRTHSPDGVHPTSWQP